MKRPFENRNPTELQRKLRQVAKDARRLLKQMGIEDPREAMDGPGDQEVFDALGLWTSTRDDRVTEATDRIGRLVTILEAAEAARLIETLAEQAAKETGSLGDLLVQPGNSGDQATNEWIADLMTLYKKITGEEPATSVGAPGRKNDGIATGPLIRFILAAAVPLEIRLDEDALRKRVRTILERNRN